MKKILSLFLLIVFAFVFIPVKSHAAEVLNVKSGTNVPISLKETHDSKTLVSGSKVECLIAEDVVINNKTVFKKVIEQF